MKRRPSTSSASSAASADTPEPTAHEVVSEVDADGEEFDPSPELVSAYETLMRQRVPEVAVIPPATPLASELSASASAPQTAEQAAKDAAEEDARAEAALGRPMTKAEKQNAKKKRRKERERAIKAAMEAAAKPVNEPPPPKSDVVGRYHASLCLLSSPPAMLHWC